MKSTQPQDKHRGRRPDNKLLASLKCMAQKTTPLPNTQTHNRHNLQEKDKFLLSTFTAHEVRAKSKERNDHEEMLGKELRKFRSEVEAKYRASTTNKAYKFPRMDNNEKGEEESAAFNCTLNTKPNSSDRKGANTVWCFQAFRETCTSVFARLVQEDAELL